MINAHTHCARYFLLQIIDMQNPTLKQSVLFFINGNNIFQRIIAATAIVILSPLYLLAAILVKLNSSGPVLYRGVRVGKDKQMFNIYKFRTLPANYESQVGCRILASKERHTDTISHILIRTKLDELPQLWNVVLGDMAIVGPRPMRPIIYKRYSQAIVNFDKRLEVIPGITGLAQIIGGYYMDQELKQKYDNLYIDQRNFHLDIKIIILTFIVLVFSMEIMKAPLVELFLKLPLNSTQKSRTGSP